MLRIAARLQRAIVPGTRSSQLVFFEALEEHLAAKPARLDVGCGRELVPRWFPSHERARCARGEVVVGLDCDEESLRANPLARKVRADVRHLPFAEAAFDVVTANMVVEHMLDPASCLEEIRRVLKPAGRFVFHTPNLRSPLVRIASFIPERLKRPLIRMLDGREAGDVFPAVYRLNTAAAIRRAARASGLRVREIRLVWTAPATQALGPLVVFELIAMRLLRRISGLRPDIVAVLERPDWDWVADRAGAAASDWRQLTPVWLAGRTSRQADG